MSGRKININPGDNSFSDFARALALPVRVQIIRLIIENGFTINQENLRSNEYAKTTIDKHLKELRALGVLKMEGIKGHITYHIDQHWFTQMIGEFFAMFGKCAALPQPAVANAAGTIDVALPDSLPTDTPAMVYPHFGAYIKKQREALHISQEVFAKKIMMDRGEVSRIECGKRELPFEKLKVVAKVLYLSYPAAKAEYYHHQLAVD